MPSEHLHISPQLDQATFEALFKSNFAFLCNFAQQYVGDQDAAQDLCQKVFIQLWEKRTTLDPNQNLKSYLFTAVKNRCLNYIRDHKKYRSKILDLDCGDIELSEQAIDYLAANDLQAVIEEALNQLPEKCRKVFEMSRFQEMKYKEIAEELEISQKTVEAHMSTALKLLRAHLKEHWVLLLIFTNLN
ncbi:MAG: RNA polymerase sigma-70 factor [Bacteroidota bacterium]